MGTLCVAAPAAAQAPNAPPGPAYLLLELPSMRVVADARRDVLAAPVAPGSVMKLLTLAAALENGVADASTRIMCRGTVDLDGRPVACVHGDFHRALGPDEALGHSCNVFFATLAKRLPRNALDAILTRAGLPPSSPSVPMTRVALGLGGDSRHAATTAGGVPPADRLIRGAAGVEAGDTGGPQTRPRDGRA